jgi:hypothetical protein
METFATASVQDLKRLLELFPIADLRPFWQEFKGTKEEVCQQGAESKDLNRIGQFLDSKFSNCKQHVYAFQKSDKITALPETLGGERATLTLPDVRSLFVLRSTYSVVLREPLEETSIDFLWPIRVEFSAHSPYVVLRFVVLEKTVSAYFDRPCYVPDRSVDEKSILKEVEYWANPRADLHKGIKELWNNKFMDSPSAKLKKALSMAQEIMDQELASGSTIRNFSRRSRRTYCSARYSSSQIKAAAFRCCPLNHLKAILHSPDIQRREEPTLLFQKFFETISSLIPNSTLIGNPEALSKLNPNKIYPENVRTILGVSSASAVRICETAVRQGVFRKCVEVVRPDGAIAASAETESQLPKTVRFFREDRGDYEEVCMPTREMKKNIFYRLTDEAASTRPHAQPA